MSTAELKQLIDARSTEERKWMTAYLLDHMFAVPELRQTAEELSELAKRRSDVLASGQRISQVDAEQHWKVAEEPTE
jgi:Tfp pilus assembly protein PilN